MGYTGSTASPVLPWPTALAAVVLGGAAMVTAMAATAGWGLRPLMLAAEMSLVAPALLLVALARLPWRPALGLTRPDRRTASLSLVVGTAFWVASLGLFALQAVVLPFPPEYLEGFYRVHAALRPSGPLDAVFSLAAIALAPAACEELLFRGVVLPSLARRLGHPWALAVSAVLFGLIHLDLYRFLFATAVGAGLGVLRLRTGSVLPPLLAHGLLNAMTFGAGLFVEDPRSAPDPTPWLGALMLAGGATAAVMLLRTIRPRSLRDIAS